MHLFSSEAVPICHRFDHRCDQACFCKGSVVLIGLDSFVAKPTLQQVFDDGSKSLRDTRKLKRIGCVVKGDEADDLVDRLCWERLHGGEQLPSAPWNERL